MWWRRFWWVVLAVVAALAFGLAAWGAEGGFLTRLNTALLLLPLGFGAPDPDVSPQLQAARILAPVVFAYATYRALFALFSERRQEVRASFRSGHTIVCGLGNRGEALVESLLDSSKVVALELNSANPAIRRLRDAGAVVLVGDATDPEALARANAQRASRLVSVCGDDATNAQVAANVLAVERSSSPLTTFVHVDDPRLYMFLHHHALTTELEFFNIYEASARRLLRETQELRGGGRPVLVVGAGQFGVAVISQLARERFQRIPSDRGLEKQRLYLVDRDAAARATFLRERYRRFRDVCELESFALDVHEPAFDHLLEENPALAEAGVAYVCFDNDSLTIATALNLLDQAHGRLPVAARVTRRGTGIAALIQATQLRSSGPAPFLTVSLAEPMSEGPLALETMRSEFAREVHEEYRRRNERRAADDKPWDDLEEEGRDRNLRHADDIARQLAAVGYRLGPLVDWGEPQPDLPPDAVERMAEMEHERWKAERIEQGYELGPLRSDAARNLVHPELVPYAELPEDEKEYNRRLVRLRPALLARAGIRMYRV
jgi:voltage-gated potassium channel Kch